MHSGMVALVVLEVAKHRWGPYPYVYLFLMCWSDLQHEFQYFEDDGHICVLILLLGPQRRDHKST